MYMYHAYMLYQYLYIIMNNIVVRKKNFLVVKTKITCLTVVLLTSLNVSFNQIQYAFNFARKTIRKKVIDMEFHQHVHVNFIL